MRSRVFLLAALASLAQLGCADWDMRRAGRLERKGAKKEAVAAYERFLEKHPGHPRTAEAAYIAGRLYSEDFGRCAQALPLFEKAARLADGEKAPGSWSEKARLSLLSCPDFFPLSPGRSWVYVDSASGGENMRLEILVLRSSSSLSADITGAYFAGDKRTQDYKRQAAKEGWSVMETVGGEKLPILKYPFRQGHSWEGRQGGKSVRYSIVEDGALVETKAGKFTSCLKVKSQTHGYESWVYDYYCAGVGRVKTTVGVPEAENPNTELASYK